MKKIIIYLSFLIIAFFYLTTIDILAKPIFQENSPLLNLYADNLAHKIGDIITIIIDDEIAFSQKTQNKSSKDFSLSSDEGKGLFGFFKGLGLGGKSKSNSSKDKKQQDKLKTTMTVKVVKIDNVGNLYVKGSKIVIVNGEKRKIILTGIIRPSDIESDNSISSKKVGNLYLSTESLYKKRHPGIITTILRLLF